LPLSPVHEHPPSRTIAEAGVTTGVPPTSRATGSVSAPDISRPSLGVVVVSTGDQRALAGVLTGLVPACRESATGLVVIRRGPPSALPELDEAGVRVVFGRPDEDEGELRTRGIGELASDILVITTDTPPRAVDWSAMLSRLGQVVQLRGDEVEPGVWLTRLRNAGVPEPAS